MEIEKSAEKIAGLAPEISLGGHALRDADFTTDIVYDISPALTRLSFRTRMELFDVTRSMYVDCRVKLVGKCEGIG